MNKRKIYIGLCIAVTLSLSSGILISKSKINTKAELNNFQKAELNNFQKAKQESIKKEDSEDYLYQKNSSIILDESAEHTYTVGTFE